MDRNQGTHKKRYSNTSQHDVEALTNEGSEAASLISIEQLQRLVRLLDRSDVSELELKRPGEGTLLILRKAKAPETHGQQGPHALLTDASVGAQFIAPTALPGEDSKQYISAHLVGVFHRGVKPRAGALVAVGDRVKEGQLVATIESLNVINEVESPVAGRVVEILVQEGQSVEYGQHLMVIDSALEDEEA